MEAGLWFVIAMVLFTKAARAAGKLRTVLGTLCASFLVFGISDVIEARTGAWWKPWTLLTMKIGCVLVLIWGFRAWHRVTRKTDAS